MLQIRRLTGTHRIMLVAAAIAVAFGAGSAFVAYGTGGPAGTAFYGCLTKGGILYNMSVGTAMGCKPNDTAITWMSYTPTALDATYVNEGQPDSITTDMITDGEVGESDLGGDSVTSDKIEDGTVTEADLADNSVNAGEIINGSVGMDDLATGAVNADKIDRNTVQQRVSDMCPFGQTIYAIYDNGTVSCEAAASTIYEIHSDPVEIGTTKSESAGAYCRSGDRVTGGGVWTSGGDIKVRVSHPTGNGWGATVRNDHPFEKASITVIAICMQGG